MTGLPSNTEILIIGAGPTGLALAAELRRLGATPLLIDKIAEGTNTSRAAVVHARTLEVLEPAAITQSLLERGLKIEVFRIRDGDKVLAEISLAQLDTAYPFALLIPQNETEAILLQHLRALGGEVVRPAEAVAIRPWADGVEVDIARDGQPQTVAAKWVIGCDGTHSRTRQAAGIGFDSETYPEDFVLADVHMSWSLGRGEVGMFSSPAGMVMVAPLPGSPDRYRIVGTVDEAPPQPDMPFVQAILDKRVTGANAGKIREVLWSSRFRIHHGVAASPRSGRILICGDAAHVHSPAGGQGMNTGIQDAVSLAQPLLDAVRTGDDGGLHTWAKDRHAIAKRVVDMTDYMTKGATVSSAIGRRARNAALSLVSHIPAVRNRVARRLAELDNR